MSRRSVASKAESSGPPEEDSTGYSLATLRHLNPITHRIIDDTGWQLGDLDTFEQRFSAPRYYLPPPTDQISISKASSGLSMAPSATDVSSTGLPSLAGSDLTLASYSEALTNCAGSVSNPLQNLLEAGGSSGALLLPSTSAAVNWQCPFGFLGCENTFEDMDTWDVHCQAHFRGTLPRSITCPFVCSHISIGSSGTEAWQDRKAHIQEHHCLGGQSDPRVSQGLINHLWRTKVITNAEEQELRRYGRLIGNNIHLESASTAREFRQRDLHLRQL